MFKILFLCFVSLFSQLCLHAQVGCKTYTADSTEKQVCYFTTGQKSTEISYPRSNPNWKNLKAYDLKGNVIYSREYGRRWGSSGVDIKYYPNGGLSSARYTMQPDGGIQHTDITTYFTPEGKVDHEDDRSIGNNGSMRVSPVKGPAHVAPKPNECAPVPASTQIYLINYTSERLHIRYQFKDITSSGPGYMDIEPSDTTKLGIYYPKGRESNPLGHYTIEVETKPKYDYEYRLANAGGNSTGKQYVMVTCSKIQRR